MSILSLRWSRFIYDSIFTLILAFMLSVLFLAILGLDYNFQIIIGLVIVAAVISTIHGLLCKFSEKFFWKFAFLLPGDIYYYILAQSESKPVPQGRKILVTLPTDSNFILSKPDPDEYKENKTEVKNSDNWLRAGLQGFFLKLSKILINWSNRFAPQDKSYVFTWVKNGEISENGKERLKNFLTEKFSIDWVKIENIKKIDNEITIEADTEKNSISLKINQKEDEVILKINSTDTDILIAKTENGELKIYKSTESNSDQDKSYVFTWVKNGEISENGKKELKNFLTEKFNIDWVKIENIKKIDNEITIKADTGKNSLSLKLNEKKAEVILEIDGIETDKLIAKTENELKIYKSDYLMYLANTLEIGESMSIVLWLHTKDNRKIIARDDGNTSDKEGKLDISHSHCEWEYGKFDFLSKIYLLLSKNLILLLGRSLIMTFLFLLILWQNPPLMIVAEPMQIQENWTKGEDHYAVISTKNIGCDLLGVDLLCTTSKKQFINANWSPDENPIEPFKYGDIRFINLSIDNTSSPGEYRGSIVISAEAQRIIVSDHHILPSINISIGRTNTKKLVEVPFFIRITPKLNSTGG